MRKQFFFHGSPSNGESTAANVFDGLEEKIYNDFFRNGALVAKSPYLLCEIKRWKERYYSIYSFYHNGRDYSKRPNGHCVLTLVVEGFYCQRIIDIYNLMVLVYETGLCETLHYIDNAGNFLISSFYGKKDLEYLQQDFYNRLDETQFKEIDSTFQNFQSSDAIEIYNPNDVDSYGFTNVWKRDGKVIVSENELAYVDQINVLQKQSDALSKDKEKYAISIKNLETKITELSTYRHDVPTTNATPANVAINNELEEENRLLKTKIQAMEQDCEHNANTTKYYPLPPLLQQAKDVLQDWFPVIAVVLLLMDLLGTFYISHSRSQIGEDEINPTLVDSIAIDDKQIADEATETKIDSLEYVINTLRMFSNASIDVKGMANGKIKKGKTYTWSIQGVDGNFNSRNGLLKVNGEDVEASYIPKERGKSLWVYYYYGIEVKQITITVE